MDKDPRKVDLYYAVGEAIYQWGLIENEVGRSFSIVVSGGLFSTIGSSRASIAKIQSFRSRLEVVDAAISAYALPDELRDKWVSLHDKLGKKNNSRNELAHFGLDERNKKFVLRPYYSRVGHIGKMFIETSSQRDVPQSEKKRPDQIVEETKGKALSASCVWQRAQSFKTLKEALLSFNVELDDYSLFIRDYMQNKGVEIFESYLAENRDQADTQNSQEEHQKNS